jgi:hypothetical protein
MLRSTATAGDLRVHSLSGAAQNAQPASASPLVHLRKGHTLIISLHVSGVLRSAARARDAGTLPSPPLPASPPPVLDAAAVDALAVATSHPTWMVGRWALRLGPAETLALLQANNRCRLCGLTGNAADGYIETGLCLLRCVLAPSAT